MYLAFPHHGQETGGAGWEKVGAEEGGGEEEEGRVLKESGVCVGRRGGGGVQDLEGLGSLETSPTACWGAWLLDLKEATFVGSLSKLRPQRLPKPAFSVMKERGREKASRFT